MNAPQTAADFDRIRDRELNAHLDSMYDAADAMSYEEEVKRDRLCDLLNEFKQAVKLRDAGGKVDYIELAGGFLEQDRAVIEAITFYLEAA